ncbi:FeoB-associated Cys-rich membrane protein [Aureivirga sp. CE67]|nr:FeoB-associated Cys-rich membrane protein [Aureivirga sp. CE67]
MQKILVYIALALAIFYLVKKYILKSKKKNKGSNCSSDCGCGKS